MNGRRVNFLNDPKFFKLKTCLENAMQPVTKKGVVFVKKQASVITKTKENAL